MKKAPATGPRALVLRGGGGAALPAFSLFLLALIALTVRMHYWLPEPVVQLTSPETGLPQFSEAKAFEYIHEFSEVYGYRTVATKEHADSRNYLIEQVHELQRQFDASPYHDVHEFEIAEQDCDGSHRLDFMNKPVFKKYHGLRNVIVRLSDGTDASKRDAILINAHLDSTLPSPGAADDAMGIAIMLEAIRILSQSPQRLHHALVFLFNDAEESLQDASHGFIVQHPWKDTIRSVVNLEACGVSGSEILFQATSREMIAAYSYVPRPYGTVMASDIFATGLILSDTDFRMFADYGNLTGLDMAVVGHSYFYHTDKDRIPFIQKGTTQHFGDNIVALLQHVVREDVDISHIERSHDTVYFSVMGKVLVMYSLATSEMLCRGLLALLVVYITFACRTRSRLLVLAYAFFLNIATLLAVLVVCNAHAALFSFVLNKSMIWFSNEAYPLVIYVPMILLVKLYMSSLFYSLLSHKGVNLERSVLVGTALLFTIVSLAPIASSYWSCIVGYSIVIALILNDALFVKLFGLADQEIHVATYFIASTAPVLVGIESSIGVLDIFVPLTGRIGEMSPVDNIIAVLVSVTGFISVPTLLAYMVRLRNYSASAETKPGKNSFSLVLLLITVVSSVYLAYFTIPYDEMHPRRVFVQVMDNFTSMETSMHFAVPDRAAGAKEMAARLSQEFGSGEEPSLQVMDEWLSDWDTVYPFSQFLTSYRIPMEPSPVQEFTKLKPKIGVSNLKFADGIMNMTLTVRHPGLIWTVLAFDAEIVDWSLPDPPIPDPSRPESLRHHIREVSVYGIDSYELPIAIKHPEGQDPMRALKIDFIGMDPASTYPARKHDLTENSIRIFSRMDNEHILPEWAVPAGLFYRVVSGVFEIPLDSE